MEKAEGEMKQSHWYHYQIINDDFERAVAQLKEIIVKERQKRNANVLSDKEENLTNGKDHS